GDGAPGGDEENGLGGGALRQQLQGDAVPQALPRSGRDGLLHLPARAGCLRVRLGRRRSGAGSGVFRRLRERRDEGGDGGIGRAARDGGRAGAQRGRVAAVRAVGQEEVSPSSSPLPSFETAREGEANDEEARSASEGEASAS